MTGIPQAQLIETARLLGRARTAMVLTSRGAEQQSHGVDNVLAFINVALALGKVGQPFSGYGTITGQGNGQGGREHGQKADQLPGYRRIDDPAARRDLAAVWGIPESDLPGPGKSAYELIESAGEADGIRALLVVGSNPVVSAPNARRGKPAGSSGSSFWPSPTSFCRRPPKMADVVLPSAQWAEEDGTVTNLEGRVIRRRRALEPPVRCAPISSSLRPRASARQVGVLFVRRLPMRSSRSFAPRPRRRRRLFRDHLRSDRSRRTECSGRARRTTIRAPHDCFKRRFRRLSGRARFHAIEHAGPAEVPDEDFPLYLTTGRLLAHYQSGTQTRRVPELVEAAPQPIAEIHPQVAKRHGLTDGDPVVLRTRRGSAIFTSRITADIRPDTIFVPFHWPGEASANRMTNDALDPVSRMPEFKVCAVRIEHR